MGLLVIFFCPSLLWPLPALEEILDPSLKEEQILTRWMADFQGLEKPSGNDVLLETLSGFSKNLPPPPMNLVLNPRVRRFIVHYSEQSGRYKLEQALFRMKTYAPMIQSFAREYGLPEDIAYLTIIESGFRSNAVSKKGAAGVWQLMKKTARLCGLKVARHEDERKNVEKSTRAAFRHLSYLAQKYQRNWDLVLAAYNSGDGYISRWMRKHRNKDFWDFSEIRGFKKETFHYVPQFYAVLYLARYGTEWIRQAPLPCPAVL